MEPNFPYILTVVRNLNHINPVHILGSCFFNDYFNIILIYRCRISNDFFLSSFSATFVYYLLYLHPYNAFSTSHLP